MISEKVLQLCTGAETVSSLLAADPTMAPGDAWKKLYGHHVHKEKTSTATAHRDQASPDDLKRALECGKWGPTEPSELFLRLYHDALCTLDHSVSGCMVSPPLMGSCGTIPLTVISVVPDIMRHMSNLIVRAEKEVVLATNYWQNSVASKYITNAMRELNKRAGERGVKIVFKLEYDRGSPKQVFNNHMSVSEKEYMDKAIGIPSKAELPNLDLQVVNYHKPMVGTFHCKYMIVDRKYAVLQSNNIQDNDNMEMMISLEGPIVDSLYDMALISWSNKLEPPLPSHNSPAVQGGIQSSTGGKYHDSNLGQNAAINSGDHTRQNQQAYVNEPGSAALEPPTGQSQTDGASLPTGPSTTQSVIRPMDHGEQLERVEQDTDGITDGVQNVHFKGQLNEAVPVGNADVPPENPHHELGGENMGRREFLKENTRAAATTGDIEHIAHQSGESGPDGLVSGHLKGHKQQDSNTEVATGGNVNTGPAANSFASHGVNGPDEASQRYFGSGEQVLSGDQIRNPSSAHSPLPEHTTDNPHYDHDIAGEVARVQTAVTPKTGESRVDAVTHHLNHTKNVGFAGNAPECVSGEEMTPYIPHPVNEAFPIAMVCREPYGTPNHSSVYNPQNEVWLSALRHAKKNVFIQSPTLNAEPLVPAIIEACERGIDVFCYICLGYNDTGELLPKQGGTNEMIAAKMYTSLSAQGKQHLHYFFYIGKDQTVPLVANTKKRSCHVKVMIVDEHIGIQGNGNQDTQSWYHSQEINVMFDSAQVCRGWIDGLRRNQNTHLYGQVGKEDGVWRDENGKEAEGVIGVDPGKFSWAKGFAGAIKRVRGVGDF